MATATTTPAKTSLAFDALTHTKFSLRRRHVKSHTGVRQLDQPGEPGVLTPGLFLRCE